MRRCGFGRTIGLAVAGPVSTKIRVNVDPNMAIAVHQDLASGIVGAVCASNLRRSSERSQLHGEEDPGSMDIASISFREVEDRHYSQWNKKPGVAGKNLPSIYEKYVARSAFLVRWRFRSLMKFLHSAFGVRVAVAVLVGVGGRPWRTGCGSGARVVTSGSFKLAVWGLGVGVGAGVGVGVGRSAGAGTGDGNTVGNWVAKVTGTGESGEDESVPRLPGVPASGGSAMRGGDRLSALRDPSLLPCHSARAKIPRESRDASILSQGWSSVYETSSQVPRDSSNRSGTSSPWPGTGSEVFLRIYHYGQGDGVSSFVLQIRTLGISDLNTECADGNGESARNREDAGRIQVSNFRKGVIPDQTCCHRQDDVSSCELPDRPRSRVQREERGEYGI